MTQEGKYSLTQEQFEALRPYLSKRWEQVSLDAAHRLMVLGESPKVLSDELGLTRQNLHRVVKTVWAAFLANLTQMGTFSLEEPAFYSALRPIQARYGTADTLVAYRLMVLGESLDEIQKDSPNMSADHLIAVAQNIWASHQMQGTDLALDETPQMQGADMALDETPPGWVSLTVTLPKDKAREVELMEREVKAALLKVKES